MKARFILGKFKIIDTYYDYKTGEQKDFLKEVVGLTSEEKWFEDFLNQPCKVCGVLRGNHSLATMGANLHPFTPFFHG